MFPHQFYHDMRKLNVSNVSKFVVKYGIAGRASSVECASAWYADGRGFDPHVRQYSFMEIMIMK